MELEYTGRPLAAMMSLPNLGNRWLWTALWEPHALPWNAESIDHLIADGWIQFGDGSSILETQLYTTARIFDTERKRSLCFYRPDKDTRTPIPVILSFSIDAFEKQKLTEPIQIPMLNPFPLPQLGEYAYVGYEQAMDCYHISQLDLAARQRWDTLGTKLREISAPSQWPAFTERHALASNEADYQERLRSLQNQQRLAIGQTQYALIVEEAHLGAAHMHIEQIREMLNKPWRDLWQDIQITARDLAHDYYHYHLSLHPTEIRTEPEMPTAEQENIVMQDSLFSEKGQAVEVKTVTKKKERRPALPPQRIVAKRNDYVSTRSDSIQREVVSALRIDKSLLKQYPQEGIARFIHEKFYKDKGQFVFDIGDGKEAWGTIVDTLNMLGDSITDTYFALMALGIDQNGVEHLTTPFLINPDDILAICGKEKSHRSYTPGQRADVIKNIKALALCRIRATFPAPGYAPGERRRGRLKRGESKNSNGDTVIVVEGALIDLLSFKIGEYNTITGEEIWERQSIAIGTWAKAVPGLSNQTAIMLRQVLKYSAKNQRFQKRLGTYLTMMFRANAKYGGKFPHGISTYALLEGAGIVMGNSDWDHPERFKERIEKAFNDLQADNVIGRFWQEVDASPTIEKEISERAYKWIYLWLEQKWNFEPPTIVRDHYKNLLQSGGKPDEPTKPNKILPE